MIIFASLNRIGSSHWAIRTSALVADARPLTRRALFIRTLPACALAGWRGLADRLPRVAQGGMAKASVLRQTKFAGLIPSPQSLAFCPASDGGAV